MSRASRSGASDTADFAVIGRGMMGTACARHLSEAGHSVVLVGPDEPQDRRQHAGPFGSFHDAGRITRRVAHDADWARLSLRSIERYSQLEAESGLQFYAPCGGVMAGPTLGPMADQTPRFLSVGQDLDPPCEMLEGDALAERFPAFRFAQGTVATHDPIGGHINPRVMRQAEELLAVRAGAKIQPSAAVTVTGSELTLVDGTHLSADQVVHATGAYAQVNPLTPRTPAMKVFHRTVLFAEVDDEMASHLSEMPSLIFVPDGFDHDLYLLPPIRYPDGRLYLKIGGERDSPRPASPDAMRDWFQSEGNADVGQRLLRCLKDLMPDLRITSTSTGACAVSFTETGFPYIARMDARQTILSGGNGAGAKCADELGRLGAITAMGGALDKEGYATDFSVRWETAPRAVEPAEGGRS